MHTRQSPAKAGDCGYAGTLCPIKKNETKQTELENKQNKKSAGYARTQEKTGRHPPPLFLLGLVSL